MRWLGWSALLCACGGSVAAPTGDAGAPDSPTDAPAPMDVSSPSCVPAMTPGQAVLVSCASKVVLAVGADPLGQPAPMGSECKDGEATYALTFATQGLEWAICNPSSNGTPWKLLKGARQLLSHEYAAAIHQLGQVVVSVMPSCTPDVPVQSMTITEPGGDVHYLAAIDACGGGALYVDDIGLAFGVLAPLAHP